MPIEVTERWSEESLTRAADGWRAVRAFDVIGTDDQDAALTADDIPDVNDAHAKSAYLKMRSKTARHAGFNVWVVTCNYSIPTSGDRHTGTGTGLDGDDDPFLSPLRLSWANVYENVQTEYDRNDNPIYNSALRPFDPPPTRTMITKELTVIRNEPYYDVAKAHTFENTVNSDEFEIRGYGNVAAGLGFCKSILPTTEYTQDASFVEIAYKFWLRAHGHRLKVLDQGYNEDLVGVGQVKILGDDGRPVNMPVLLNGTGTKLAGVISGANRLTWPALVDVTDNAVWLYYDLYAQTDFSEMQL